jgi:hypothetical protein
MARKPIRKVPGKGSLRLKAKTAAWDDAFLASLIAAEIFHPISWKWRGNRFVRRRRRLAPWMLRPA